jgi:hypothetical protein
MITDVGLTVYLRSRGWVATLEVEPPRNERPRPAIFSTSLGRRRAGRIIKATVFYTTAYNRDHHGISWPRWHVKVYRCQTQGDAEELRLFLRRQAIDVHTANAELDGPTRGPLNPPWAVVPVHIVRGDCVQDDLDGIVLTELAASAESIHDLASATLPTWFAENLDVAARTLLAISPEVDRIEWEDPDTPATEHLREFRNIAAGLDELHRCGTAHCDVRPDHVYRVPGASEYVLIDADAAMRMDPPPMAVRSAGPFAHRSIREWDRRVREGDTGLALDVGAMRANDHFGFALCVLTAIAGRTWVRDTLLWTDELDPNPMRRADRREDVLDALRRRWAYSRRDWHPLIEALVAPFGVESEIGSKSWSAVAWLEDVLRAEAECAARRSDGPLPRADAQVTARYDRKLRAVRQEASRLVATRVVRVRNGCAVIQASASAVAWRAAWVSATRWGLGVLFVALLLTIGAWGWNK